MSFQIQQLSLLFLLISFSFLFAKKVAIFGATGRTGREVVNFFLNERDDVSLTCVVKDFGKARELFGPDTARLSVLPCDVVIDSAAKITRLVNGADAVIFAAGNSKISLMGPYRIDYLGTKKTIDACVDAGIPKFVLLSSILANGLAAGQALNPQYLLLNSFGGILLMKRQAEIYLQQQNRLKYTIVRPGGLRDQEPTFPVLYGAADSIFGGSISRKQVGKIVAEAALLAESDDKIIEVIASSDAQYLDTKEGFLIV